MRTITKHITLPNNVPARIVGGSLGTGSFTILGGSREAVKYTPGSDAELTLAAGSGISLNVVPGTIIISAPGGGSGTVTSVGVKMNGTEVGVVTDSGSIDLGTVITSLEGYPTKEWLEDYGTASYAKHANKVDHEFTVAGQTFDGSSDKTVSFVGGGTTTVASASGVVTISSTGGTVTSVGVKMNGTEKGVVTESGSIDLGTVITVAPDTIWGQNYTSGNIQGNISSIGKMTFIGSSGGEVGLEIVTHEGVRYLHTTLPFYSDSSVSAGGLGTGGGGGTGGINTIKFGDKAYTVAAPDDAFITIPMSGTNSITAHLGIDALGVRVKTLEDSYVTSVVGRTGAVNTTHIANALTAAGYKLTDTVYELTKAKVEAVLTGNITTHTHDQYALGTALTELNTWIRSLFTKESDGQGGYRIKANYGLYTDSFLSAGGLGSGSGGGGGLIETVYKSTDLSRTFSDSDVNNTFNAYTTKLVYSTLTSHTGDSTIHVTVNDKSTWNGKQDKITETNKLDYGLLTNTPTALKNPYSLTFGSKTYDGSSAKEITASDLGALTSHQTIYDLIIQKNGTKVGNTYNPATGEQIINITDVASADALQNALTAIGTLSGYFDNGSAKTAIKLKTARTLWGNSFDGSANVSGALTFTAVASGSESTTAHLEVVTVNGQQYLHTRLPFYSDSSVSAGGLGQSGGTGGGVASIYVNSTLYTPDTDGKVTLPDYPTSLDWSNIQNKPTWIGSTKPSYSFSEINGIADTLQIPSLAASKITSGTFDVARIPDLSWSKITSGKPTTVEGYGITDTYTKTQVDAKDITDVTITAAKLTLTRLDGNLEADVPTWNQDTTGNAATATKLRTLRTLWGRSFDGSTDISGNIDSVGIVSFLNASTGEIGLEIVTTSNGKRYLHTTLPFYSDESVSAGGLGSGSGGGGVASIYVNSTLFTPDEDGKITLPDYPTSLDWANIQNKPTTIAGYSITDALSISVAASTYQPIISDLDDIRTGAGLGATALQPSALNSYRTASAQDLIDAGKVPTTRKVNGHALSADVTVTKGDLGLGNVENKSSATIRGELTASNVTTALGATYVQNASYASSAGSVAWANVSDKPTKLSDFTDDVLSGHYLPLSGGTMTGEINLTTNVGGNIPYAGAVNNTSDLTTYLASTKSFIGSIYSNDTWYSVLSIRHRNGLSDGNIYGMYIKSPLAGNGNLVWRQQTGSATWRDERTIYDSGNLTKATLGLGNVDNTADVNKSVAYAASAGSVAWANVSGRPTNLSQFTDDVVSGHYLPLRGGTITDTLTVNNTLTASGNILLPNSKVLACSDTSGTSCSVVTMNTSNVVSFGYGAAVKGYSTTLDGNIISFRTGTVPTMRMYINASGNVGIGTTSPSYKLDVAGDIHTSASLHIGSIELKNDNGLLHIVGGMYADGQVSAGGLGTGGGGGGGISSIYLDNVRQPEVSGRVDLNLSNYALKSWVTSQGYATQQWVNGNYLMKLGGTGDPSSSLDVLEPSTYIKVTNVSSSTSFTYYVLSKLTGYSGGTTREWKKLATLDDIPSLSGYAKETWVSGNFSPIGHTHSYLPLSGGTITGTIAYNSGGNWISARDHCAVKTTKTSGEGSDWHPVVGIKTSAGFWSFGSVGGETLCFSHDTDADYSASSNTNTRIDMPLKAGTIALTSDIPSLSGYATQTWVQSQGYLTQIADSSISTAKIVSGAVTPEKLSTVVLEGIGYGATAYSWGDHASAGYITSSGSCAYATSAGNADTLDGRHASYFATASSLGNYLPLSGGNITGSIVFNGISTVSPLVRNFTSNSSSGWSRKILSLQVDGIEKFAIGGYGNYTAGAEDNDITYAYVGCNAYNGLNLRITATSLTWGTNNIYHSGNCNNTSTPWSCSNLTVSGTGSITGKLTTHGIVNVDSAGDAPIQTRGLEGSNSGGTSLESLYLNHRSTGNVLMVNGGGSVGIGTTSPSYKLDVNGSFNATSGNIGGNAIATQSWVTSQGYKAGTVTSVSVKRDGAVVGTVTSSGTIDLGYGAKFGTGKPSASLAGDFVGQIYLNSDSANDFWVCLMNNVGQGHTSVWARVQIAEIV